VEGPASFRSATHASASKLVVRRGAFGTAVATLRLFHPNECGGVLIGTRSSHGLLVHDTLHVPWEPELVRYVRGHALAQALLDSYLACHPADSPLGYVGEWHSHPTVHSASEQDLKELSCIGRRVGNTVGLIVIGADSEVVRPYAYTCGADGVPAIATVVLSSSTVTEPARSAGSDP
jgi:proteasome lid subunit RPN8/RPN11